MKLISGTHTYQFQLDIPLANQDCDDEFLELISSELDNQSIPEWVYRNMTIILEGSDFYTITLETNYGMLAFLERM